ncbi:MAG: histidine kinase dimerization/phospho-acceptor domain-containing protein, partial [Spongiibacteraceae bacterium]
MTTAVRLPQPQGWKIPQYIGAMAAAYAFIGGLISLTGWLTGIPRLTDWWNTGVSIKANTAIAITAAAVGLLTLVFPFKNSRRVGQGLGLFTLLIGGVTLLEHITNFSVGIDTLLFDEPAGALATSAPGRMGPPAALCFLALGIALFLRASGTCKTLGVALSLAAVGISMLSLVGYWYGAKVMYMLPRVSGIAAQSATMLLALGVGIISTYPDREPMKTLCEDSGIGILARRVITAAFIVPLVLGWLNIQGTRAGIYDSAFGTALRSIIEIVILISVLGWSIQAIRLRELRQRRAEAERQITEQRLVHMLESMTDGFVTFDESWHFNYVNGEAARIFSRDPTELIGTVLWEEFPEIINTPLHAELHRAALARISIEVESPDFVASGSRHFRHRIYPAVEGGLSVYMQDVTARKQAEDALREANRRKDEFLATLAHELRNPLAPIRSAAAILMEHNVPPPTIQSSATIIDRQVRHMARLLEDLLDIARISRSRLELRKAHIDLTR